MSFYGTAALLATLAGASLGRAAELRICDGPICQGLESSGGYTPDLLYYGDRIISPTLSADGFVARVATEDGPQWVGGLHGGETGVAGSISSDGLTFRRRLFFNDDDDGDQEAGAEPIYTLTRDVLVDDGRIAYRQTLFPTDAASAVDVVYGLLMNVDAAFSQWRAFNHQGDLLQAITADANLSNQRLGGSDGVARVVAYDPVAELAVTWEAEFRDDADDFWFIVPQGVARSAGHKLYARLRGYEGRTEPFFANWTVEVAPLSAEQWNSGAVIAAVPEPSSCLLLAPFALAFAVGTFVAAPSTRA